MLVCIALLILFGIVTALGVISFIGAKNTTGTEYFYQTHSLEPIASIPASIFEAIKFEKYCRTGTLNTAAGIEIPFYWCEWSYSSTSTVGNARQSSTDYYFGAAFSPGTVSEEFIQQATRFKETGSASFSEKLRNFFILETKTPFRVEKLSDGSFLICWRAARLAADYERAFEWLENNVSSPPQMEIPAPKAEIRTIPRISFSQFLEAMPAAEQDKSRDIISLTDAMITDYHDTKSHPNMSLEDYAEFTGRTLEEARAASRAISEIQFPVDEYLAKGYQIPELQNYESTLAYRLNFPARTLIYLDRPQIFLDDSGQLGVYFR